MKPDLFLENSDSLAGRFLTRQMFDQLTTKITASGFTLEQALRSGMENPDSGIGIYAGDEESYALFSDLFSPVILAYHNHEANHISDFDKPDSPCLDLPDPDPEKEFILSTRIRVARNLEEFPFPPHISAAQRSRVLEKIVMATAKLPQGLKGEFFYLDQLTENERSRLVDQKIAFPKGDRFMESAGINRDFPKDRGVFFSQVTDETTQRQSRFLIWANEEDHLRIISMENSSNLSRVFQRLVKALAGLSESLEFAKDETLGYLTACPSNIGTAMRAGVHIRLKHLEKKEGILKDIAGRHGLQIRGTFGEKTKVKEAVFDISNKHRLGASETQIMKTLYQGVCALIQAEKENR